MVLLSSSIFGFVLRRRNRRQRQLGRLGRNGNSIDQSPEASLTFDLDEMMMMGTRRQ